MDILPSNNKISVLLQTKVTHIVLNSLVYQNRGLGDRAVVPNHINVMHF
jgi:hypothetical protein